MATRNNSSCAGRRAAAMAAGAGTLAFAGAILAAGLGRSEARADALCDQMRAQYGPSWPCISVPTYTPPPTMNAPTSTPGAPGTSHGGAVIGGDAGPGPGTGNGTPIVGDPAPKTRPTSGRGPAETKTEATVTVSASPEESRRTAGSPVVSRTAQAGPTSSVSDRAFIGPTSSSDGAIPTPIWAIVGAAAVAAAGPRTARRVASGRTPAKSNVDSYGGYELSIKSEGDYSRDTSHIKPRDVAALLRECFNCYFPVEGAPREFPKVGDELPLVIEVAGVRMDAPVRVTEVYETDDDFSFEFVGLPGHFDGEGSTVRFHFWNDGEQLILNVYATTTDAPVPDFFNKRAAEFVWGRFLGNVVAALAY